MRWQRTLKRATELTGVALHSGAMTRVRLHPAPADTGVIFRVATQTNGVNRCDDIRAHIANVDDRQSQLCTQLTSASAIAGSSTVSVSTIEHLMAALAAASITNAYIDVDEVAAATAVNKHNAQQQQQQPRRSSVEVPILDGSSFEFVDAILDAGIHELCGAAQRYIRIERPVQVLLADKAAWFLSMPQTLGGAAGAATRVPVPTLELSVQVNFAHKGLGTTFQRFTLCSNSSTRASATLAAFRSELAPARTFTFEDEIAGMRAMGLARGGSLDNAVVFQTDATEQRTTSKSLGQPPPSPLHARVLNPHGLRFPDDEWTRHKLLDCIGDIALAGLPLHGHFVATSPGHALTHALLRELLRDEANYSERIVGDDK